MVTQLIVSYALILIAVFLTVVAVASMHHEVRHRGTVHDLEVGRMESPLLRMSMPYMRGLGAILPKPPGGAASSRGLHKRFNNLLIASGNPLEITTNDFFGMVAFGGILGIMAGGLVYFVTKLLIIFVVCAGLGTCFPLIWLTENVKRRAKEIRRTLPYALDLLTLVVEGGMDFTGAINRIMPKLGTNALGEEFRALLRELQMGKSRKEGLRRMSERAQVSELTNVCVTLIQADEMGASLGPILRIQSETLRIRRSQLAEEMAMKAPVKMLFPLLLFIFPTIFIVLFAPIFIRSVLGYE